MNKLVSVVVVSYNAEKYIVETLESIKKQTYSPIELIITDDASNDKTLEIVRAWVADNKSFFAENRIIANDINRGTVFNCNSGIKESKGVYIKMIAADDILDKDSIKNSVYYQEKYTDAIVIGKIIPFGENKSQVRLIKEKAERGYLILKQNQQIQKKEMLRCNYIYGPSGSFFRREIYEKVGMYDERFPLMEDYPYLIRLMEKNYQFRICNYISAYYRVTGNSVSNGSNKLFDKNQYDYWNQEKKYIIRRNRLYLLYYEQWIQFKQIQIKAKYGEKSIQNYFARILLLLIFWRLPQLIIDKKKSKG